MLSTSIKKNLFKRSSAVFQAFEEPKTTQNDSNRDEAKRLSSPKWISWRQLSPKNWQLQSCAMSPPPVYFFHGDKLGPRPLIVLDEVVSRDMSIPAQKIPRTSDGCNSVGIIPLLKYEGILSHLQLEHGVMSLPLYYDPEAEKILIESYLSKSCKSEGNSLPYKDFLTRQCESVIQLMDTYHIQWANILCRSTGALLAAKLALLYPERVGGLISLDTPLVSRQWQVNTRLRREILKAIHDVNVPTDELIFSVRGLIGGEDTGSIDDSSLEPVIPVPCPSKPLGVGSKLPFYCYQHFIQENPVNPTENAVEPPTSTFDNVAVFELINSIATLNRSCYEDTIFYKDLVYPGINITHDSSDSNCRSDTPFPSETLLDHPLFTSMTRNSDGRRRSEKNVAVGLLRVDGLLTSTKMCDDIPDNNTDASSGAMIHNVNANPTVSDTILSLLSNRVRSHKIGRHQEKLEDDNDDSVRGTRYSLHGSAYLSIDQMRYIKHPLMLIVPPSSFSPQSPLSDIDAHKTSFNIRKATVVKSAGVSSTTSAILSKKDVDKKKKKSDNKENVDIKHTEMNYKLSDTSSSAKIDESDNYLPMSLFQNAAVVKEVAHHCRSFLNRFDFDVVIRRRTEQVARETLKKLEGAKSVGVRSSGDGDSGNSKKKKKGTGIKS